MGSGWSQVLSSVGGLGCLAAVASSCGSTMPTERSAREMARETAGGPKDLAAALGASCSTAKEDGARVDPMSRQGSSVALTRRGSKLTGYVADRDRDRVLAVDLDGMRIVGETAVFGAPEQLLVLRDGRVVVSIADRSHVEVLSPTETGALARVCARPVAAGPFGLAATPEGDSVAVVSAWEPTLTVLASSSLEEQGRVVLPRAPRGVVIDGAGKAFVTHLVGTELSVVDLMESYGTRRSIELAVRAGSSEGREEDLDFVRSGGQAFSLVSVVIPPKEPTRSEQGKMPHARGPRGSAIGRAAPPPTEQGTAPSGERIIVPMVSVDPGTRDRAQSTYYGPPPIAGVGRMFPTAIVVDPSDETSLSSRAIAPTGGRRSEECLLPRATAAIGSHVLVACDGIDQLLELDGRTADPLRSPLHRFAVPPGPTGVAVDEETRAAVVYSARAGKLSMIGLDGTKLSTLAISEYTPHLSESARRGRNLFYRSDDPRITNEGMACTSCHPDGTEDGMSWSTPEGLRQTPMLAGRLRETAPYGWTRGMRSLSSYVSDTCSRLGGTGLPPDDLADLSAFLEEMPSPPGPDRVPNDAVDGGKLFVERGCGFCHQGGVGTDGVRHQLGKEKEPIDTPSLRRVARTAPYFHDGRYPTLQALLADPKSGMGSTAKLTPDERRLIERYLETL